MDIFNNIYNTQTEVENACVTMIPKDIQTPTYQVLQWEKELLGLYFSSHPLDKLQEFLALKNVSPIRSLSNKRPGTLVVLGCLITTVKRITTKKNERMAFLSAEDKTGSIDILVFPSKYEAMKDDFLPNKPVLIAGRLSERDGAYSVVFEKSMYIDEEKYASKFNGIILRISKDRKRKELDRLKKYIKDNPGDKPVKLIIEKTNENNIMDLKKGITITEEFTEISQPFT